MFSLILSVLSFSLCVGFPLLLTIKLVNLLDIKSDSLATQVNQLRFLFNYWIYYVILAVVQNSLVLKAIDISLFNIGELLFFFLKIWLFYGKGCLVLSYYYVNSFISRLLGNTNRSNLEVLEIRFIDPVANIITMNTVLLNHGLNFLNHLTGSNNIVNSVVLNFQYFILTLTNHYKQGNLRSPYFIGTSLQYFCSIDNLAVYKQYKLTNQFLGYFTLKIPPTGTIYSPKSSRNPSRKLSNPTLNNRKVRVNPANQPYSLSFPQSNKTSSTPHQRANSNGSHQRSGSGNSLTRPIFSDNSDPSTPKVFLTPEVSPRLSGRTISLTETLDDLEPLDPRTLNLGYTSPDTQSEVLKVAIEEAIKSKGIDGSGNYKSTSSSQSPTNQLNMPPNTISIDKALNEFTNDRNRSRSSSLLSNPPYPVN